MRSKEGTHRIEVNLTDDIIILRNKVYQKRACFDMAPVPNRSTTTSSTSHTVFTLSSKCLKQKIAAELKIIDPSTITVSDQPNAGAMPMDSLSGKTLGELNVKYVTVWSKKTKEMIE